MSLNRLLRRYLNLDLAEKYSALTDIQAGIISDLGHRNLELVRLHRDLIAKFLILLDKPEEHEEARDMLHQALIDLSDEVARLEEALS